MYILVIALTALLATGAVASPQFVDDGRYYGGNDGRYIPDNSGQYNHDNSGQYNHDNSGAYNHDDSGAYRGSPEPYRHQDGGQGSNGGAGQETQISKNYGDQGSSAAGPCAPGLLANKQFRILKLEEDTGINSYHYAYETENKIEAEETGQVGEVAATNHDAVRANGYFQYVGPDCRVYRVDYRADENGFQPVGEHLPTPPPVPEAILRSLAYNGIVLRK